MPLFVLSSEAGRAFRPSVAAIAEARALVSFTREHAYEDGAGERRAPAFKLAGLSAEIARDALLANGRAPQARPPFALNPGFLYWTSRDVRPQMGSRRHELRRRSSTAGGLHQARRSRRV
jgi:hypothetical protein